MTDSHPAAENYLEAVRSQVPRYDELQDAAIAAIPLRPSRVLELGIGTAETSRRLLARYPAATITGLDSDPDMVFRARDTVADVQLARMEDPLPDGPWDLVISVLSVHELTDDQKRTLFRRVKEQSRSFVLGDFVTGGGEAAKADPARGFPDTAEQLAEWCEGEIAWAADDLAVIRATYE